MGVTVLQGDCRDILPTLPSRSVHAVVTSPPYWQQRDYGMPGQLGQEEDPEEYVVALGHVLDEVWRVLRDDGTVWLNLSDTYRDKEVLGLPWKAVFHLQRQGWRFRAPIIWSKNNPKPESAQDRPNLSHEYLFLLAKRDRYFYDGEAVREKSASGSHNCRSVWEIPRVPAQGEHTAVFPRQLVVRAMMAATSEGGVCSACGAPYRRIMRDLGPAVEHQKACGADASGGYGGRPTKDYAAQKAEDPAAMKRRILAGLRNRITEGWEKPCTCDAPATAATVLDPFAGSGTVGEVAQLLDRNAILIELNPDFAEEARGKVAQGSLYA